MNYTQDDLGTIGLLGFLLGMAIFGLIVLLQDMFKGEDK